MASTSPLLADSATRLGPKAVGAVLVTGSHGGLYAAYLAARAGVRAALFNDAGVGLDGAGIAGLAWLEALGIAAAAVDHRSARIGDAADMLARGRVSHANLQARALGVRPGQTCERAADLLGGAARVAVTLEPSAEARRVLQPPPGRGDACRLVLIDSAALVEPEDAGQFVVTGSHGALFGGDPLNALKVQARLAAFNDAGVGIEEVGVSRLPALQDRGIAGVTVAAASARIGEADSSWRHGVISRCNALAEALGARTGQPLAELAAALTGIRPDAN